MAQSSPMNSGDGTYSYTKNSTFQRTAASAAADVIREAVIENLDIKKLLPAAKMFAIADLGCSVGPNTFYTTQTLIEAVETLNREQSRTLEFQVFFNDQTTNDFNTLLAALPHPRNYFAAAVPGSFYGRLFPSSSIHVAYTSYAIHWLSKVPEALLVKDSPAWNPGKIHYTGASDAVVKAYTNQFEADMDVFLRERGEEIAAGGMILIIMPGVPDGVVEHGIGVTFTFIETILMDMVKEGVVEEDLVDSFNIPHVYPSVKEMQKIVEKNGSFEIVKMELSYAMGKTEEMDLDSAILHLRAISEGIMANHFGNDVVEQLFARAIQHKLTYANILLSSGIQIAGQLFAALKRK